MKTAMNGSGRTDAIQEFLVRLRSLLDALNEEGVEATTALRERIAASIDTLQPRLEEWRELAADTASSVAGSVQDAIEDHPWGAVAAGAVAGVAVGCVAAVVASNFLPESDFAGKADHYRRRLVSQSRPYVRRARKLANNYWPF
jgi:ElaB/YqjD/DUF883 family membrane-anchored ribosome-binding protein